MKAIRQSSSEIDAQARLLCTRIDSDIRKPAVILVTSAEVGDGASYTALSLAKAFAKFGRRTALVDATGNARGSYQAPSPMLGEQPSDEPTIIRMRTLDRNSSRDALGESVASFRQTYDITIIDTLPVLDSNSAMALGDVADATLVTVRFGRVAGPGDEIAASMLEACKGQFLGVVTTDGDEVERFEQGRTVELSLPQAERAISVMPSPSVRRDSAAGVLVSVLLIATWWGLSRGALM